MAAILLNAAAMPAFAVVPQIINYQGVLRENDAPVTGGRTMRFLIFDSLNGGNQLYDSGQVSVSVSTGIFRYQLTPPATINWQSIQPYIEVRVGSTTASTVLSPRDSIASSVYALFASTAEVVVAGSVFDAQIASNANINPAKISGTAVVQSGNLTLTGAGRNTIMNGVVGIGEPSPAARLEVRAQAADPYALRVSSQNASPLVTVTPGGSLGIGTDTPQQKLHVGQGSLKFDSSYGIVFGDNSFMTSANVGSASSLVSPGDALIQSASGNNVTLRTGALNRVTILSTGQVGINTAVPDAQLQVTGGDIHIDDGHAILSGPTGSATSILQATDANTTAVISRGITGVKFLSNGLSPLATITNTGNMGIGTTAPAAPLDVNGIAQFGSASKSTFTAAGALNLAAGQNVTLTGGGRVTGLPSPTGSSDAATKGYVDATVGTGILASTNTWSAQQTFLNQLTISTGVNISGNVGIGTTNPSQALDIVGSGEAKISNQGYAQFTRNGFLLQIDPASGVGSGGTILGTYNASISLGAGGAGNEQLIVKNTGNVGIGTIMPAMPLDVNGAAQFGSTAKSTVTAAGAINVASGQNVTLSGGGKVIGLATPSASTDAATKGYVDGLTAGGQNTAVLASTQTFSGQNTFLNQVTVSSGMYVSGSIGVGTVNPTYKLEIAGINMDGMRISGANPQVTLLDTGNSSSGWMAVADQPANWFTDAVAGDMAIRSWQGKSLLLGAAGGSNLPSSVAITPSANVGIGTATPLARVDISSAGTAANALLRLSAASQPNIQFCATASGCTNTVGGGWTGLVGYPNSATHMYIESNSGPMTLETNSVDRLTIDSTGNVGIGSTTAPGNLLVVGSGNGVLNVQSGGRVGIGTPNPGYALDVVGDINTSGDIRKNGTIYTNPDYVFDPKYSLRSMGELRRYLAENKHLPGVPSDADVRAKGVLLFEQNRLNLEKLEEAYLYILQLEKRIERLEKNQRQEP